MTSGPVNRGIGLALGITLAGFLAKTGFAFSDDGVLAACGFSKTYTLTNSAIAVTCSLTNNSTNTLRGFFYGEHLPVGLTLASLGVTLNGRSVTNYVLEAGQSGDVYAGCIPWRWILEAPTNYTPANPVPPQGVVQISFSLSSSNTGTFSLQQFNWADGRSVNTNGGFGYSELRDQQLLSFLLTTNAPTVVGYLSSNLYVVSLQGVAGASYALDWSTNLTTWQPVTTNLSSFFYTNAGASQGRGFYRGRISPGP